jgi:hypothetical protein
LQPFFDSTDYGELITANREPGKFHGHGCGRIHFDAKITAALGQNSGSENRKGRTL